MTLNNTSADYGAAVMAQAQRAKRAICILDPIDVEYARRPELLGPLRRTAASRP
jgi:hypothetical protein